MTTPLRGRNADDPVSEYFWYVPHIMVMVLLAAVAYCQVCLQDPQFLTAIEQQSRLVLGEPENGPRLELIKDATEGILAFSFGLGLCFFFGSAFTYLVREFVSDPLPTDRFPA